MEKLGLFQRCGDKFYSRDYALHIPCECIQCPINRNKYCSMASAIQINSGGKCQTGYDLIQEELEKQKQQKLEEQKQTNWSYKTQGD